MRMTPRSRRRGLVMSWQPTAKERVWANNANNVRIKEMQFCVMSPEEIVRYSEMEVFDNVLYDVREATVACTSPAACTLLLLPAAWILARPHATPPLGLLTLRARRTPLPPRPQKEPGTSQGKVPRKGGPLDMRLGTSDKKASCQTCGCKLEECPGHFGHIRLALPVYHVGYFKATIEILQCICKTCSRLLIPIHHPQRAKWAAVMNDPLNESAKRQFNFKQIQEQCKKVSTAASAGARACVARTFWLWVCSGSLEKRARRWKNTHVAGSSLALLSIPISRTFLSSLLPPPLLSHAAFPMGAVSHTATAFGLFCSTWLSSPLCCRYLRLLNKTQIHQSALLPCSLPPSLLCGPSAPCAPTAASATGRSAREVTCTSCMTATASAPATRRGRTPSSRSTATFLSAI